MSAITTTGMTMMYTGTDDVQVSSQRAAPTARRGPVRVLLVDDHAILREGLRNLIDREPDLQVVGEAGDGLAARSLAPSVQPDVVLLDISMPRMNGVDTLRWFREALPQVRVLALTMHEDRTYLREMLKAGAAGYLLKRSPSDELLRAIRQVADGGVCIDPALGTTLVESLTSARPQRGELAEARLSERETEVLMRVAEGYSNKEIAAQLRIGIKTVETYKARSMDKLGLDSRTGVIRYALQQGWLKKE